MTASSLELDLRALPPEQRHGLVFQTFDALAPGEAFVIVNDHDPAPLLQQFKFVRPGESEAEYVERGPTDWRVRIRRKDVAVISDELRAALTQEGSAAFVTQGPGGPHLVATWNSYLRVLDDRTIAFPAGGYRRTEENIRSGSEVQMILGAKNPKGIGFRLSGRAEFQVNTPVHERLKADYPWCRAAVQLRVTKVEKVLG